MSDSILEKLKAVEAKFEGLQKEVETLQEQVNEGNRQIQLRREELMRLQGEYRALQDLAQNEERAKKEPAKKKK